MSTFGFLLIKRPPQTLIMDKTLHAFIERNEFDISFRSQGGLLKSKKSKFQKTILKVYRGDVEAYRFRVTVDDEPFDLTGRTITATARISPDSEEILFTKPIIDGINGTDFANGIIVLVLDKEITAALPTTCNFDIESVLDEDPTTLVSGELVTDPDITRP